MMDQARKNAFFSMITSFLARDLLIHNPAIMDARQAMEYARELIVLAYIWEEDQDDEKEDDDEEKTGDPAPIGPTKH